MPRTQSRYSRRYSVSLHRNFKRRFFIVECNFVSATYAWTISFFEMKEGGFFLHPCPPILISCKKWANLYSNIEAWRYRRYVLTRRDFWLRERIRWFGIYLGALYIFYIRQTAGFSALYIFKFNFVSHKCFTDSVAERGKKKLVTSCRRLNVILFPAGFQTSTRLPCI